MGCGAVAGASALGAVAEGADSTAKVEGTNGRCCTGSSAAIGAAASGGAGVVGGILTAAGFSTARCGSCVGCSGLIAVVVPGFTTTEPAGGDTTTTGRVPAATPAGGLATTVPAGGREAIAGVEGGATTIGGACRVGGTIFRGSGRAGADATVVAAGAT
jgi:hypothetical protein